VEEVLTLNRRDRLNPVGFEVATLAALIDELRQTEEIPADAVIVACRYPHVSIRPRPSAQIVWNLLRNAWRFCRSRRAAFISVC